MSFVIFGPSDVDRTELREDENWKEGGTLNLIASDNDDLGADSRTSTAVYFKVDVDSLQDGGSVVFRYSRASGSSAYYSYTVNAALLALSAITEGVACISFVHVNDSFNMFVNGHLASQPSRDTGANVSGYQLNLVVSANVKVAGVMLGREAQGKPIRWWYVRNLTAVKQVGDTSFEVSPEESYTGFQHKDSFHVEMETDFEEQEGSKYIAAYVDVRARYVRNSVQFGTAEIRANIGDKPVLARRTGANTAFKLTLLDVGVETMSNVGGRLSGTLAADDLKKIGVKCDIEHEIYEDVL